MFDYSKLLSWLKSSSTWSKIVVPLLLCALSIVYLLSSCGVTRATIRNPNDSSYQSITITTNNPTQVHFSSSIDSTKFNINPNKK